MKLDRVVLLVAEKPAILWPMQNSDDLSDGYRSTRSQMNRSGGLEAAESRAN